MRALTAVTIVAVLMLACACKDKQLEAERLTLSRETFDLENEKQLLVATCLNPSNGDLERRIRCHDEYDVAAKRLRIVRNRIKDIDAVQSTDAIDAREHASVTEFEKPKPRK